MKDFEDGPESATAVKPIRRSGTSLTVTITDLAKALDLSRGDYVEVTLKHFRKK